MAPPLLYYQAELMIEQQKLGLDQLLGWNELYPLDEGMIRL